MATKTALQKMQFQRNRLDGSISLEHYEGTKSTYEKKHVLEAVYDFAVLGGAVGAINLLDKDGNAAKLPAGAIIDLVILDIITSVTSGGSATVSFGTGQTAVDILAATAKASLTAGLVAAIPVGTAATSIKITADCQPSVTVAVAALTAGKIYVLIEYFLSDVT